MSMLDQMINTATAIKRGYIEITEEEFNILKKEIPTVPLKESDLRDLGFLTSGASAMFMGVKVYVKGKDHVKN